MLTPFVALEEDKCQFVYLLAKSSGATRIVEAGTRFGVPTVYLALAKMLYRRGWHLESMPK